MLFISIDAWLSQTSSWRHSRSDTLKALDEAIRQANAMEQESDDVLMGYWAGTDLHSDAAKNAIALEDAKRACAVGRVQKAFTEWVNSQVLKGQDWRKSVRNEHKAVENLSQQLEYWRRKLPASAAETHALEQLKKARDQSIPLLFKGCTCVLKASRSTLAKAQDGLTGARLVKHATKIAVNSRNLVGQGGSSLVAQKLDALLPELVFQSFGVSLAQLRWGAEEEFFRSMLGDSLAAIKAEMLAIAPGVGLLVSSVNLLKHTIKLVQHSMAIDLMADLIRKLDISDPQVALQRIRDWQLREIAMRASKVARTSANMGGQLAAVLTVGAAVPAQTIIGICNAVVGLVQMIAELGMQYQESRNLTRYLNQAASTPLGRDIFAASPLAAAYYLLNTPTSHIALQLVEIGSLTWREDVEHLVRNGMMATVIKESERLIDDSRYMLVPPAGERYREQEGKTIKTKAKELLGRKTSKTP